MDITVNELIQRLRDLRTLLTDAEDYGDDGQWANVLLTVKEAEHAIDQLIHDL